MTKITDSIGYAKIDSLSVSTLVENATIRADNPIGQKIQMSLHAAILKDKEINNWTYGEDTKTPITIAIKYDPNSKARRLYIPMNAKWLGIEKYHEGLTTQNIGNAIDYFQEKTQIQIDGQHWQEARFTDLDNCIDTIETQTEHNKKLLEIYSAIDQKIWNEYGLLRDHKNQIIRGTPNRLIASLEMGSREKQAKRTLTALWPYLKYYSKLTEATCKAHAARKKGLTNQWAEAYIKIAIKENRQRFESAIQNQYWTDDPLLKTIKKPEGIRELMNLYHDNNTVMVKYAQEVIHRKYLPRIITEAKPRERDMSQETASQFARRQYRAIHEENQTLTGLEIEEQILNIARQKFSKTKVHDIKKILDEDRQLVTPQTDPRQIKLIVAEIKQKRT